ncbi:MAG: Ni/Fe-hydrogenase cytochrome b subunit [Magnetospirillum sp.]|nr:Ni/Fe-hydrogenase cytochrome b subunit [Magnetospirillum sp.]
MGKFHNEHEALGGSLVSKTTVVCAILALIAAFLLAKRMVLGLGSVTNLNNGYPWGIWIAYDVVIGTAFACGGYAMALVCYILNKGEYHPLVRPALLASCFGYTLGGVSIVFDLGRWWNAWHILAPQYMQPNSVMFEVALCVMSYILVLWIEFSPAIVSKFAALRPHRKKLEKLLFVFVALGCLLPTMHQSSLGTLLVVLGYQIHPLWQTPLLPLLFLCSAICMGFSIVVFEAVLGSAGFKRSVKHEMPQLAKIARIVQGFMVVYLVLRFADIAIRGEFGAIFTSGLRSLMFLLEIVLFAAPIVLFSREIQPAQPPGAVRRRRGHAAGRRALSPGRLPGGLRHRSRLALLPLGFRADGDHRHHRRRSAALHRLRPEASGLLHPQAHAGRPGRRARKVRSHARVPAYYHRPHHPDRGPSAHRRRGR